MAVTTTQLIQWKQEKRPIVALTAWDYCFAQLLDEAGVDLILVGDSLGMVALGYETTLPVTLEQMLHHTAAVCRGVKRALVVCDLPFLSYQQNISHAINSAGRVLKETGAQAVKVEGGNPIVAQIVSQLTTFGIPVMGHVGLTPQSVHKIGYKQQGNNPQDAEKIFNEAIALVQAGVFAIILEHIPSELAKKITERIPIPTIGIGAGNFCDGQVLVTADLLGLTEKQPPFANPYVNLRQIITQTVQTYASQIREL